jgi:hypothetical protein
MSYERKAMFTSAFIVQSSAFNDSLAAALLDERFEHPAGECKNLRLAELAPEHVRLTAKVRIG